jgi:hypothetical protein
MMRTEARTERRLSNLPFSMLAWLHASRCGLTRVRSCELLKSLAPPHRAGVDDNAVFARTAAENTFPTYRSGKHYGQNICHEVH